MIVEIYGNYNFFSWLKYWYIDSVVKQTIILMDKTRVIYHKDEKCKKACQSKRRANAPITPDRAALIEENKRLGEEMQQQLLLLNKNKEEKKATDKDFIDKIAIKLKL